LDPPPLPRSVDAHPVAVGAISPDSKVSLSVHGRPRSDPQERSGLKCAHLHGDHAVGGVWTIEPSFSRVRGPACTSNTSLGWRCFRRPASGYPFGYRRRNDDPCKWLLGRVLVAAAGIDDSPGGTVPVRSELLFRPRCCFQRCGKEKVLESASAKAGTPARESQHPLRAAPGNLVGF